MQPKYAKPSIDKPEFSKPEEPCYDYRNYESAGKYRGVGYAGKVGHMASSSESIDAIPPKKETSAVKRDHG